MKDKKNLQMIIGGVAALGVIAIGYYIYKKLYAGSKIKYWKVFNSAGNSVLVKQNEVDIDEKGTAYFKKDGWVYNLDKTKGYEKKKDDWAGTQAVEFIG